MSAATAAAVGMFDGVHLGHRHLLATVRGAAAARSLEPVAVTFSRHPLSLIRPDAAPKLLLPLEERLELLRGAGASRAIVLDFDEPLRRMDAGEFMAMLRDRYGVRCLVVGFNNRFGHDRTLGIDDYRRLGASLGIDVVGATELAEPRGVSSSAVRRAVAEGRTGDAAAMLGRPYALEGTVVAGRQLGRRLGFPTANIEVDPALGVPAAGVYAAATPLGPAMVNVGVRPTVAEGLEPTVEAHIIGYGGDLYGSRLRVEFGRRLREERRFESLEALRAQLEADRAAVLKP